MQIALAMLTDLNNMHLNIQYYSKPVTSYNNMQKNKQSAQSQINMVMC